MNPRRIQEGVVLDGLSIACDGFSAKRLSDIVSIQLWPFVNGDGADSGRCDIRFADGTILSITGMGHSGAITRERDLAYAAFLHSLHRALNAEGRARIAFLDGMQGGAAGLIAIAVLFCGPVIGFTLYASATRGPIWLLGLTPALAGIIGVSVWYWNMRRPNLYSPDNLPSYVLPASGQSS
jgi:hypothetical protein